MVSKDEKAAYDKIRREKIKNGTWESLPSLPNDLTSTQREHLIGALLGDGCLYFYKNAKNAGLSIGRQSSDIEYLKFQFEIFKDFCHKGIYHTSIRDKRTEIVSNLSRFRTRSSPLFQEYRELWYPDGVKKVPPELELTPYICAIWFCDDGSATTPDGKRFPVISLYTDGFSKQESLLLINKLNKLASVNDGFKIQKKPNGKFYIRSVKIGALAFTKLIDPYMPDSMNRKSSKWRNSKEWSM